MTDSQWISLREFARRCNRTHRAAQVAIASGRIPASAVRRSARGRIVAVEFREGSGSWRQNSAPRVNQPPVAIAGDLAGQGTDTYSAARTAREGANAKLAELEYLKTIGRVVAVEDVKKSWFRRLRMMRDQLLDIPARLAAVTAAESDPHRVEQLLTAEITRVLHELADAADGTEKA